jgi:hypothetical protein
LINQHRFAPRPRRQKGDQGCDPFLSDLHRCSCWSTLPPHDASTTAGRGDPVAPICS